MKRPRISRLLSAVVALLLGANLLGSVQALAASTPVPPTPVGSPKGTYTSGQSCVKITVSPTVVRAEGTISYVVSAGPNADDPQCRDWQTEFGVSTGYYIPNGMGPFCNQERTECHFEAFYPTDGVWAQICAYGPNSDIYPPNGPGPSARSCADFYVTASQTFEVSGRVTNGGPTGKQSGAGQGAGGITIKAVCNGDSSSPVTTTTDANGDYSMQLPLGNCQVSVAPPAVGAPQFLSVGAQDFRTKFTNIDFVVVSSCSATQAGTMAPLRPASGRLLAGAAPSGTCLLDISVKALEPLRSGLAVHSEPYLQFPVDFVSSPEAGVFRCQSGCTDLVVTVTNPRTHKGVAGAIVNASVSPISAVTGSEYLCRSDGEGRDYKCKEPYVLGLTTDEKGRVFLRYWAPGVIRPTTTLLSVTAKTTCSSTSCPYRHEAGSTEVKLTVSRYLIYQHSSTMGPLVAEDVAAWGGGGELLAKLLGKVPLSAKALKFALAQLEKNEVAAEVVTKGLHALEAAELVLGVLEVGNAFTDLEERESMIAEFLYQTDLDAAGIGDDPSEATAPGTPSVKFSNKLVNYGVVLPFEAGAAGAWWDIAETLHHIAEESHRKESYEGYGTKLSVYEVSSCDPVAGDCMPGYRNAPGYSVVLRGGIEPELYFDLSLTFMGYNIESYAFMLPYDAIAWTETQAGLRLVIHDRLR